MTAYADCPCTDAEWGGTCPACGQLLPRKAGRLRGWRSEKLNTEMSEQALLARPLNQQPHLWPGRATKRQRDPAVAYFAERRAS